LAILIAGESWGKTKQSIVALYLASYSSKMNSEYHSTPLLAVGEGQREKVAGKKRLYMALQ